MQPPQTLSSHRAFEGRVFNVRVDRLREDDGSEHRIDVVEHVASMAILAMPDPGNLLLVRQYRHAVGRFLWEIPAGTAEPGEDPHVGALRELREETGYRAGRIEEIGRFFTTPGFCSESLSIFWARELAPGAQALDDDERIEVQALSVAQAWELVRDGGIADAKTVLALHLHRDRARSWR